MKVDDLKDYVERQRVNIDTELVVQGHQGVDRHFRIPVESMERIGLELVLDVGTVPPNPEDARALTDLRELVQASIRMCMTPIVDDDFPEMKHNFDSTLRSINRRYKIREDIFT